MTSVQEERYTVVPECLCTAACGSGGGNAEHWVATWACEFFGGRVFGGGGCTCDCHQQIPFPNRNRELAVRADFHTICAAAVRDVQSEFARRLGLVTGVQVFDGPQGDSAQTRTSYYYEQTFAYKGVKRASKMISLAVRTVADFIKMARTPKCDIFISGPEININAGGPLTAIAKFTCSICIREDTVTDLPAEIQLRRRIAYKVYSAALGPPKWTSSIRSSRWPPTPCAWIKPIGGEPTDAALKELYDTDFTRTRLLEQLDAHLTLAEEWELASLDWGGYTDGTREMPQPICVVTK